MEEIVSLFNMILLLAASCLLLEIQSYGILEVDLSVRLKIVILLKLKKEKKKKKERKKVHANCR